MPQSHTFPPQSESQAVETIDRVIQRIAREGARSLLQRALEAEIANHLDRYTEFVTEDDKKTVVRNGFVPGRSVLPVSVRRLSSVRVLMNRKR